MLQWLSEKLSPSKEETPRTPEPVSPEAGAAALIIEAAHRGGSYTEVERDIATAALMKLFSLNNAEAVALRREAQAAHREAPQLMRFAQAARDLDVEKKEQLITKLWEILDSCEKGLPANPELISSVTDVMGLSTERARALRLPVPTKKKD